MLLIKMFPLHAKTFRACLTAQELTIIDKEVDSEREFGRALPNNSFFKLACIRACRRGEERFKKL